jgi:hypothetical protein
VLNTLQYLIVDEILLARILEQRKSDRGDTRYRDEESDDEENGEEGIEDTNRKARDVVHIMA